MNEQVKRAAQAVFAADDDRDRAMACATYPDPQAVYEGMLELVAEQQQMTVDQVREAYLRHHPLRTEAQAVLARHYDVQEGDYVYGSFARPATEYWGLTSVARKVIHAQVNWSMQTPHDYVVTDELLDLDRFPQLQLLRRPW